AEAEGGEGESGRAPGREDGQVTPAQPGPCRVRVVGGQQGGGQGPDGEDGTDVDEPARQLAGGGGDAGDEAGRENEGQGGRHCGIDVADQGGHGEAQAAEHDGCGDDVQGEGGRGADRDRRPVGGPPDDQQRGRQCHGGEHADQGTTGDDGARGKGCGSAALV